MNYLPTSRVASCFIDQTRSPLTPGGASRREGGGTEVTISTRVDSACSMPIEICYLLKIFQPFGTSSTRQDGWSSLGDVIKSCACVVGGATEKATCRSLAAFTTAININDNSRTKTRNVARALRDGNWVSHEKYQDGDTHRKRCKRSGD